MIDPGELNTRLVLEAPPGPLVVRGVEGRIVQVFRNLLGNAISFSPARGHVRVKARPAGALPTLPGLPDRYDPRPRCRHRDRYDCSRRAPRPRVSMTRPSGGTPCREAR